jgi:DNA-binding response OmpR family regulator
MCPGADRPWPQTGESMARVLIADEGGTAAFLQNGFEAHGFSATVVDDGAEAVVAARDSDYDLVVLDLRLPGKDGLEVLIDLRARGERMPVIVMAPDEEHDTAVAGLEHGADDCVRKPFAFEELMARARLRLREAEAAEAVITAGPMTLDLHRHAILVDDVVVDLPGREFALAEVLFRHQGQVLSRQQLLEAVWGHDAGPASKKLEVYVLYLRRKLGDEVIENIRGRGYRLRPDRLTR